MKPAAGLSLEQAPPISVPFRFFMTAPLFGLLAAGLLLWAGPEALVSRWTQSALALSHLLALGVISMVMVGALMQMLPVLVGVSVARPRLLGGSCHGLLAAGTAMLALAFMHGDAVIFHLATAVLAAAFILFLGLFGHGLLRAPRAGDAVRGMRWVWPGLTITVVLGVWLALGHGATGLSLQRPLVTDLHLVWGLLGWIALLVAVVAWQVVPMFQMTPHYPKWLRRWLAPLIIAGLAWLSLALWWGAPAQALVPALLLAASVVVFAGLTLWLLGRRRRGRADAGIRLWQFGLLMLILAGLLGAWQLMAADHWQPFPPMLPALLFLTGFALSIILAMLMKIMPFLVWLHLQQRLAERPQASGRYLPPGMKTILPDRAMKQLAWLHMSAATVLPLALFFPALTRPAAVVWIALFALLFWRQLMIVAVYRRELLKVEQAFMPAQTAP